jgi:hypothetical protein
MRAEDLRRSISQRATRLWLISLGKRSRAECEKAAAREIALEERQQRASAPAAWQLASAVPNAHNARAVLLARINAVAERMRAIPARRNRLPRQAAPVVLRPHVEDTAATAMPQPAPASEPVLVFTGRATVTEVIAEGEFHTSMHDLTTANWRASIERNERAQQRRRGLYVG